MHYLWVFAVQFKNNNMNPCLTRIAICAALLAISRFGLAATASETANIDEILIGYFGPDDSSHPQDADMWRAAQLAVEEANRQGGYRSKPFRLVPGWSENPWGTGVVHLTRMAYVDRVWAIIGGIDGDSTHLAEQVVAKARLALVSPVSSDRTVNLANVPWTFSLVPGDHLQAPVVAAEVVTRTDERSFVLVSTDDHDARRFTAELRRALGKHRVAPRFQFECRCGAEDIAELVGRALEARPAAVVVVAGAGDSARLFAALRKRNFPGTIFGGPAVGRRRFLDQAGPAAEGAVYPLLCDSTVENSKVWREFAGEFEKCVGTRPDYAAAHTYDAVCLTVAAVRQAGLDRSRIRDALRDLSPWMGVTGTVRWDRRGSNTRAVRLGTVNDGCRVPASKQPGPRTVEDLEKEVPHGIPGR